MTTALLGWVWLATGLFVFGCAWRALRYLRAPDHLRWDLYPLTDRSWSGHGDSDLQEKDRRKKPIETSQLGKAAFMIEEILLLQGVRANDRQLWRGSLPFHWGLYLLGLTSVGLVVAGLGLRPPLWMGLITLSGAIGGVLTTFGTLILLILRAREPRLRPYTTPADRLNLALLSVLGTLSAAVAIAPGGMAQAAGATGQLLRLRPPDVSTLLGLQMALAALFISYLPFTRMVHFFSKYFTYHHVRWDDRPVTPGSALERRLRGALDFGVDWSAEHIRATGSTWAEVAKTLPEKPSKKDGA